jgi:CBS-domain-containing membrane protein
MLYRFTFISKIMFRNIFLFIQLSFYQNACEWYLCHPLRFLAYLKCGKNLLGIDMRIDLFSRKILLWPFQKFKMLAQPKYIQILTNSYKVTRDSTFKF